MEWVGGGLSGCGSGWLNGPGWAVSVCMCEWVEWRAEWMWVNTWVNVGLNR